MKLTRHATGWWLQLGWLQLGWLHLDSTRFEDHWHLSLTWMRPFPLSR